MTETVRVKEKKTGKLGTWIDHSTTSGPLKVLISFDGESVVREVFFHDIEFSREGGEAK